MTTGPVTITYSYQSCRDCEYTDLITTGYGVRMRVCDRPNLLIPPIKDRDGKEWFYVELQDMTPNDKTPFWCPFFKENPIMHVYQDWNDWYVAESALDARNQQAELVGEDDASPEAEWALVPDDTPEFTIINWDGTGHSKTMSIQAWIAERGRGLLCSTDW